MKFPNIMCSFYVLVPVQFRVGRLCKEHSGESFWDHDQINEQLTCKVPTLFIGDVVYQSPLTPADLLIALHNMDDKVDMKTTIKGNVGMC